MIKLTRLNHHPFVVNLYSIQYIEATPDTIITFNNGERIVISETVDDVIARAAAFLRDVHQGALDPERK
jgi:flagellar protein FlbD